MSPAEMFGTDRRCMPAGLKFVLDLGVALHRYGTPAHRIEDTLVAVSAHLGIRAQFFSTPTSLIASFGPQGQQRTSLQRVDPQGITDLEKLVELNELAEQVAQGKIHVELGAERIAEIVERPERYGKAITVIAFALVSGAAARFFGGNWADMLAGAGIGGTIGILSLILTGASAGARLFELVSAFVAAAMACFCGLLGPVHPPVATLAGLIVLVPGLSLTMAMAEISTRNLVSGSARLMNVVMIFIQLAFGVAMAARCFPELWAANITTGVPATWTEYASLAVAALSLVILFRAPPRLAGWVIISAPIAYGASRLGSHLIGSDIGGLFGAFSVGLVGNLIARTKGLPSALVTLPGLLLLVPGALGFKSATLLIQQDPLAGVNSAFSSILAAVSLVTGLLLANVTLSPRRPL